MFEGFHQAIIEAHDREKIKPEPVNQEKSQTKPKEGPGDCSPKASESGGVIQKEVPHQGKLILDAKNVRTSHPLPNRLQGSL